MPLDKDLQLLQELISHPGWEVFKDLILHKFEKQLDGYLRSSSLNGETILSAKFAGQLEILPKIFAKPQEVLNEAMKH